MFTMIAVYHFESVYRYVYIHRYTASLHVNVLAVYATISRHYITVMN